MNLTEKEKKEMILTLRDYLNTQLENEDISRKMADAIHSSFLDWSTPTIDCKKADAIIALSFGFCRLENGNITPGQMNIDIADIVVDLYNKTNCNVYAQWEVAESIGNRINRNNLVAIYPEINHTDGLVKYLSSFDVLKKVKEIIGKSDSQSKVLIVAWAHHAPRCIKIAKELGFNAFIPKNITLPSEYDSNSSQPWTRDGISYISHDSLSRFKVHRSKMTRGV